MDPIRSRPRVLTTPTSAAQPQAGTQQAAAPARANAVGHTGLSTFQGTAPARAAAAQATPGSWRGGPDTEVGKAVRAMWERMQQMPGNDISIKGDTPASLLGRAILDSKHVTNEQLIAMSKVSLDQLATDPATRQKVLDKVPNARELPVHKFTVAMLSAATGIDPRKLSEACPDLGLTGAPNTPLLYAASSERMQRSTALHDFTDYLRGAGIKGLNKAVWGVENRILSAIVSAVGGGRY
ncbi:hypothetical protein [Myxococcus sp. RHSTA-1-4]|uniref:hypothetical protein n=1 Tax=Myxococcus sp. RHSTA-1-4 TaxID=2874601 RepID=UPI001CBB9409|nr:hypothetical protein [Myxococcus sp. RHSTA-1-4]MBZ4421976.1 hypothetical protein [Myxococcus sp. RHSTA-1-4]